MIGAAPDGEAARARWTTVRQAVAGALELPADERAAYVAGACGGDARAHDESARLLDACERAERADAFLAGPAAARAVPLVSHLAARLKALRAELPARLRAALADRLTIERELAPGGMARVFLADERALGRRVVVKVLPPETVGALSAERFHREVAIAARLQHPHVVPVLSAGDAAGLLYYTMPYVVGESLRARLAAHAADGGFPLDEAVRVLRDVAQALSHAHRQGIVHRDVKPENILLGADGDALVADFGIATALEAAATDAGGGGPAGADGEPTLTTEGLVLGTPAYMAPELRTPGATADHRADLYALGVVAYEMLAGVRPASPPAPLAARRPDVPPPLAALVARLLARDPGERPPSAGDVARALDAVTTPDAGAGPPERHVRRVRGPSAATRAAAVAVAAVAIAAATLALARRPAAPAVDPATVAVLPFSVSGESAPRQMGRGLAELLAVRLEEIDEVRAADPLVVGGDPATAPERPTPRQAGEVARRAGAGLFVLGDVVASGGRLHAVATLYDAEGAARSRAEATGHAGGDLEAIADTLARRLAASRYAAPGERLARQAVLTTPSRLAVRAFLRGERWLREGQFDSAVVAYGEAVAADSEFALAHYRYSIAGEWAMLDARSVVGAAERAVRFSQRLSPRDRDLAEALRLQRLGAAIPAYRLYTRLVTTDPRDVDAAAQFGELLQHFGALFDDDPLDHARAQWRAVLAARPDDRFAIVHLARIAATSGDASEPALRLRPAGGADPGARSRGVELAAWRAILFRDRRLEDSVRAVMRANAPGTGAVLWEIVTGSRDLDASERFVRSQHMAGIDPTGTSVLLAYLAAARGQFGAAFATLDSLGALHGGDAIVHAGALALAPFAPVPPARLTDLRRRLAAWATPDEPDSLQTTALTVVREYLLGGLAMLAGDSAEARRQAAALRRRGAAQAPGAVGLAYSLAQELRWQVAPDSAGPPEVWQVAYLGQMRDTPFFPRTRKRWLALEQARTHGGAAQALRFYHAFGAANPYELPYLAPAALRRGEIHERLGHRSAAAAEYRRVLALWRDADPELQPVVADVRARLAGLERP